MKEPSTAKERARRDERAERVREAFGNMPGFREMIRSSQEDAKAGRFASQEEIVRKHLPEG